MMTTVELAAGAVRLCRIEDRRITALETYPVPPGTDPIDALAAAPLPARLGKVGILLAHDDLLIRTLTMPSSPKDRLERLVRFELESVAAPADGEVPTMALAWQAVPGPSTDEDHRILALLVRHRLIDRLRQALGQRGTVAAISHPGLGLYQDFLRQQPDSTGCGVLLDIGGQSVHIAVVVDGALVFLRTLHPGTDDLSANVAKLRGIGVTESVELVRRLAPGSPDDLHDLVNTQAGTIAAQTIAAVRFARTQLGLTLEPAWIQVTGRGALTHGFLAALGKRASLPVRLMNPFAGAVLAIPDDQADALAALPGPWTPVIGGALHPGAWTLDALADEHRAKVQFRRTTGVLRLGAAAAIVLGLAGAGLAVNEANAAAAQRADAETRKADAQKLADRRNAALASLQQGAARIQWLDGEHRVVRVTNELTAAVAGLQDPQKCPIVLTRLVVNRAGATTQFEMAGATTAGQVSPDKALHGFHDSLRTTYPPIASSEIRPAGLAADRMEFKLTGLIPDR